VDRYDNINTTVNGDYGRPRPGWSQSRPTSSRATWRYCTPACGRSVGSSRLSGNRRAARPRPPA